MLATASRPRTIHIWSAEADIVHEHDDDFRLVIRQAAAYGVGTRLKQYVGPGGGNPNVEFWALENEDLLNWLRQFYAGQDFRNEELHQMIKVENVG